MDSSWPQTLHSNRQRVISELAKGEESAKQLREMLNKDCQNDGNGTPSSSAEELVHNVLRSFTNTLSMLHGVESDRVSQIPIKSCVKSEESEESSKSISPPRERRGCYKRRKNCESRTIVTSALTDDGHQWRKYGQKSIMNSEFPRNYYRCTHKIDQGCQATKQVQKASESPLKYKITYHGDHTCRDLIRTPQIFLDTSCHSDSSILLSFNNQEATVHNANNFPCNPSFTSFPRNQGGDSNNGTKTKRSSNASMAQIQPSSSELCYSTDEVTVFESHGGDMTVLSNSLGSDYGDVVSSIAHDNLDIQNINILGKFDDHELQQFLLKIDAQKYRT